MLLSPRILLWRASPRTIARRTTTSAATTEIRLQKVRQRVDVVQLAVFDPEEMTVRCAAAAVHASRAERTEHLDRADRLVDDEAAVGDVHAARNADVAAIGGRTGAGVRAAFSAIARIAPRDQI